MTRGTLPKTVESSEYDFVRDKAQKETIDLLAKTLIEVKKHMTAHIPEKIFDLVDDSLIKAGYSSDLLTTISTPKKEIVGYRLKPNIDRLMVDGVLKYPMLIWNEHDKSVYFIRGHVAGSLVAKMKELQVLNFWFTPIYDGDEIKSDWVSNRN